MSVTLRKYQRLDFSIRLYGCILIESLFLAAFSHTDTYMIEKEYEASDQKQKRGIEKQKIALHNLSQVEYQSNKTDKNYLNMVICRNVVILEISTNLFEIPGPILAVNCV